MKCNTCGKMNCMAHGGSVRDEDHEKGVHPRSYSRQGGGVSDAGNALRDTAGMKKGGPFDKTPAIKDEHRKRLGESKAIQPKMKGLAEGGEVDMDGDSDIDNELMDMVADELHEAITKKDKKGMVEAIKAIVMSCKE